MIQWNAAPVALLLFVLDGFYATAPASAQSCDYPVPPASCTEIQNLGGSLQDPTRDLTISACVKVPAGKYVLGNVNVVKGGRLYFDDSSANPTIFRAKSILVEMDGKIQAGDWCQPFGQHGGHLYLQLWGGDPTNQGTNMNPGDLGIACKGQSNGACYPDGRVGNICRVSADTELSKDPAASSPLADVCGQPRTDTTEDNARMEAYGNLMSDPNVFGYKVLAVSYGGSLKLFGKKGVLPSDFLDPTAPMTACPVPGSADQHSVRKWAGLSGNSWALLDADAHDGDARITLDRPVDWSAGDQVVVATTDWYGGHTEMATVSANDAAANLTLQSKLQFPHFGQIFSTDPNAANENPNKQVDLRGAVGLLSRSITIQSWGKTADDNDPFPPASACGADQLAPDGTLKRPDCYFGGHVVVRQGFAEFQLQGVELYQLGQGGRMGHYPIHFHKAKATNYYPSQSGELGNAFVKDCSIWDSNTRFVAIHATHNVTVARNVGYLSVGHGFFLEDGSEINNRFCQNLGVSARPSYREYFQSQDAGSPARRVVPPIQEKVVLPDNNVNLTYLGSDTFFPSMFWIMNAYNEFVGNKAVGPQGFGVCYWLFGGTVSGDSVKMSWARKESTYQTNSPLDYANFQNFGMQAPLKRFRGNSCSTAAYGLTTHINLTEPTLTSLTPVRNPYPMIMPPSVGSNYHPVNFVPAGQPDSQTAIPACNPSGPLDIEAPNSVGCSTTIIDRFTTSFNWADANFGSIWLRPGNFLLLNSAVTDQLFGGVTFVTGGSPEQALPRNLMISKDSIYVGSSRPAGDKFASRKGPDISQFRMPDNTAACSAQFCYSSKDGLILFAGAIQPKRLINIYDGPFFADGNVFQNIKSFTCNPWSNNYSGDDCGIYKLTFQPFCRGKKVGNPAPDHSCTDPSGPGATNVNLPECADDDDRPALATGRPRSLEDEDSQPRMLVVDAAVGWKQPNGFYYPPAFAFRKSFFGADTERHNVFDQYTTYVYATVPGGNNTCVQPPFPGFSLTPIDFTTILNDLDGTLNGVTSDQSAPWSPRTVGLSNNHFYDPPIQSRQCRSFGTNTSPAEFVTTALAKIADGAQATDPGWISAHPMVPIFRQFKNPGAAEACDGTGTSPSPNVCNGQGAAACPRGSFMMGAGIGQAPALTANLGKYFIDTSGSQDSSCAPIADYKVARFEAKKSYLVYQLYANSATAVTYQFYVGPNFDAKSGKFVRVKPHLSAGSSYQVEGPDADDLAAPPGASHYDPGTGILQVTLKNKPEDFLFKATDQNVQCQPRDICQPNSDNTACTLGTRNIEGSLRGAIADICSFWATRTTGQGDEGVFLGDCPFKGCIGYQFTLPADFSPAAYAQVGNSLSEPYPDTAPWNTALAVADMACKPLSVK